jgi:ribosomal protein L40E
MITCPACGKENEDTAFECKRCRAPFREEEPAAGAGAAAQSLGELCRRCGTYNEPGRAACSNCGLQLSVIAAAEPLPDVTPPHPFTPPSQVPETLSEELRALAITDEEAAEAGLTLPQNGSPADKTPPDPYAPGAIAPPATGRARISPPAAATGVAMTATVAPPARRPPPAPPPSSRTRHAEQAIPASLPAEKACASCGALNPPAARFCFDCGTAFAKKAAPATPPPPSIEIAEDLGAVTFDDATAESAPVDTPEPVPTPEPAAAAEPEPAAEPVQLETGPVPLPEEQPPPFAAKLVLESADGQGAEFVLAHLENSIGGSAAHVGLGEDAYVAPHAATLAFVEEQLVLRDEGSANGVYVKVRQSAALQAGDLFLAGERLLRYDGPVELPPPVAGDPPFLGAPRAQGTVVRVAEVLAGAKTGRVCYRAGSISIGRAGCDMNFGSDARLGAKHAEVRVNDDGTASLLDVAQEPTGVFLRVRAQEPVELQAGDVLRIGEQQLRIEF